MCQLLLSRTTLQLSGPTATNLQGRLPHDMCTLKFRERVEKARCSFAACVSHSGAPRALAAARGLQRGLEKLLGRPLLILSEGPSAETARSFAGGIGGMLGNAAPNEATRLLRHCVCASDAMIVMLSRGVFSQPDALIQVLTAVEMGKAVLGVPIEDDVAPTADEGPPLEPYDPHEAEALFGEMGAELERASPGLLEKLEHNGFNLDNALHKCRALVRLLTDHPVDPVLLSQVVARGAAPAAAPRPRGLAPSRSPTSGGSPPAEGAARDAKDGAAAARRPSLGQRPSAKLNAESLASLAPLDESRRSPAASPTASPAASPPAERLDVAGRRVSTSSAWYTADHRGMLQELANALVAAEPLPLVKAEMRSRLLLSEFASKGAMRKRIQNRISTKQKTNQARRLRYRVLSKSPKPGAPAAAGAPFAGLPSASAHGAFGLAATSAAEDDPKAQGGRFSLHKSPTDRKSASAEVEAPPIEENDDGEERFHLFLSHSWSSGQDQMRILKQRLLEMVPDLQIFLDLDDLKVGRGDTYVACSQQMLVFLSAGYLDSPNCVRELYTALRCGLPLIVMLEPDLRHGGMSDEEIRHAIGSAAERFSTPGNILHDECVAMAFSPPSADDLINALGLNHPETPMQWARARVNRDTSRERGMNVEELGLCASVDVVFDTITHAQPSTAPQVFEWERIGAFQDVTLRLVVERLLSPGHPPTFLPHELAFQEPKLPELGEGRHHVYCSAHNPGAAELVRALQATHAPSLSFSTSRDDLDACEHCLVYLNALTWSHEEAAQFAEDVQHAMALGVHLLLAYEALGVEGRVPPRHACEFDDFFNVTPPALLKAGIYAELATPLKQMPCRVASMVMLVKALGQQSSVAGSPRTPRGSPKPAPPAHTPSWLLSAGSRATKNISDSV